MELAELNRLERALVDVVTGDDLSTEKIERVAFAWVQRDTPEQLSWLGDHPEDTPMGAALRNVLTIVAQDHDLGGIQAGFDFMREYNRANTAT